MKKILIVEDDRLLASIYSEIFSEKYETIITPDPIEALGLIKDNNYDLVLLDIMLPTMNGYDLLKKIRSLKNGKKLPVLALTNLSDIKTTQKLKKLGALDVLLKVNYDPDQLLTVVESHLS